MVGLTLFHVSTNGVIGQGSRLWHVRLMKIGPWKCPGFLAGSDWLDFPWSIHCPWGWTPLLVLGVPSCGGRAHLSCVASSHRKRTFASCWSSDCYSHWIVSIRWWGCFQRGLMRKVQGWPSDLLDAMVRGLDCIIMSLPCEYQWQYGSALWWVINCWCLGQHLWDLAGSRKGIERLIPFQMEHANTATDLFWQ